MTQKLLVFATMAEAEATAEVLEARPLDSNSFSFEGGTLLVTGMGALSTAARLMPHLPDYDEVWNIGVAGALTPHISIGQFSAISSVSKNLSLPVDVDQYSQLLARRCFPDILLPDQGLRLLTSDYPIHHEHLRTTCAEFADVVDMEGYAVAYCCQAIGKPCRIWKLVSDPCLSGGQEIIARWLSLLARNIAGQVQELLCC